MADACARIGVQLSACDYRQPDTIRRCVCVCVCAFSCPRAMPRIAEHNQRAMTTHSTIPARQPLCVCLSNNVLHANVHHASTLKHPCMPSKATRCEGGMGMAHICTPIDDNTHTHTRVKYAIPFSSAGRLFGRQVWSGPAALVMRAWSSQLGAVSRVMPRVPRVWCHDAWHVCGHTCAATADDDDDDDADAQQTDSTNRRRRPRTRGLACVHTQNI